MVNGIVLALVIGGVLALLVWAARVYTQRVHDEIEAESKRIADEQVQRSQAIDSEVRAMSDADLKRKLRGTP